MDYFLKLCSEDLSKYVISKALPRRNKTLQIRVLDKNNDSNPILDNHFKIKSILFLFWFIKSVRQRAKHPKQKTASI